MKRILSLMLALVIVLSVCTFTANAKLDKDGNWFPANEKWDELPLDGVVARFAVGADMHFPDCNSPGKNTYLYRALSQIGGVDALLVAGDLTSDGLPDEYEALMKVVNEGTKKNPINPSATGNAVGVTILSMGNHELSIGKTDDFTKYTGQQADALYWIKGIPVISLSPDEHIPERGGEDFEVGNNYDLSADFLRDAYAEIDSSGYKGLIMMIAHHRPDNKGTETTTWSQEILDMMKAHPNTMVFTGHSHTWIWPVDEFILQDAGFTHVMAGSLGPEGGLGSGEIPPVMGRVNDPLDFEGDYDSTFTLVDIMDDGTARLRRCDNAKGEFMHEGEYLTVRPSVLTDYICDVDSEDFSKSYWADSKDPQFPEGAKVTMEDLGNNTSVKLTFPEAVPAGPLSKDAVVEYHIWFKSTQTGEYLKFGEKQYVRVGNYRLPEDEGKPWNVIIHGLNWDTDYSVEIRAFGCFGIKSNYIYSDGTINIGSPEPVYSTTPIIDFDYSYGNFADGAGHALAATPSLYKDDVTACGQKAALFTGLGSDKAFLYEFTEGDYKAVRNFFTMECYFSANDVEKTQVLMGNWNGTLTGMKIEGGKLHVWARFITTPEDVNEQIILSYPLEKNVWTHAVATYDGYSVKLYIDGVAVRASSKNIKGGLSEISYGAVDENGNLSGKKVTYYCVGCAGYDNGAYMYPVSGNTKINKATLYSGAMTEEDAAIAYKIATTAVPFTDVEDGWYIDSVEYAYATSLMSGTGDTSFAPSVKTNRAMIVQMLYNMEGNPAVDRSNNPFTDVPDTWYTDAILWAYRNGVTTGTSDTTFSPDALVTREQVAVFLYRYMRDYKKADVGEGADLSVYPDADSISDYTDFNEAMSWANAGGIIGGKKNGEVVTLSPLDQAMRSEVAKMFVSFAKKH